MKKVFLILFILLMPLTACEDNFNRPKELRFSGAGEYWYAVFIQEFYEE